MGPLSSRFASAISTQEKHSGKPYHALKANREQAIPLSGSPASPRPGHDVPNPAGRSDPSGVYPFSPRRVHQFPDVQQNASKTTGPRLGNAAHAFRPNYQGHSTITNPQGARSNTMTASTGDTQSSEKRLHGLASQFGDQIRVTSRACGAKNHVGVTALSHYGVKKSQGLLALSVYRPSRLVS